MGATIFAGLCWGGIAGGLSGAALHNFLRFPIGLAQVFGVAIGIFVFIVTVAHVSGVGYPDADISSSRGVFLDEVSPGWFQESTPSTSAGGGQYVILENPEGPFSNAYDEDGGFFGQLRRQGTGQWSKSF